MFKDNKISKPFDLIVPVITPGEIKDGSLQPDFDNFQNFLRYQKDQGVNGILAIGTTGDFQSILLDDKKRLIDKAIETAKVGKGPENIYVHISAISQDEEQQLAQYISELESPYIKGLLLAPLYQASTDDEIHNRTQQIIALKLATPLYLYNNPGIHQEKGADLMPTHQIQTWIQEGKVTGIKDSSDRYEQVAQWLKIAKENKGKFKVYAGHNAALRGLFFKSDSDLASYLLGCVLGTANIDPKPALKLCETARENRKALALAGQCTSTEKEVQAIFDTIKAEQSDFATVVKTKVMETNPYLQKHGLGHHK